VADDRIVRSLTHGLPAGSLIGNLERGTGPARPVTLSDIAAALASTGQLAAPGAPANLGSIADKRVLGNGSGATAAPVALSITQPAAGLTVTWAVGGITLALADDLAAVEGLGTTGLAARTAASTWTTRNLVAPAAGLTISNNDGVSGNPTFALADDLAALEAMGSTGLVARTAANNYAQRTITPPAAGISVSNGDGVSGNPTLALANDLAAVEGIAGTGVAVRTASDTWTTRTITGAASRLSVSNGDGVAGNPTLDIDAAYAGQASITTLGTVATGTWNGAVITGQYGGTGVANTGKTITLGGNLTTSGAFATTFTVTADSNATLPAGTNTLAGLEVSPQTWTGQEVYTFSSAATGINGAGTRLVFKNTDATAGNWTQCFSAQDSSGATLGKLQWQTRDHTNHVGDAVISARGSGNANNVEAVRVAVEGTAYRIGVAGNFVTNAPQANLHVGTTAATARSYNSFTDASNGEWAYLGDWGLVANTAVYGTDKNGTGTARAARFYTGGTEAMRISTSQEVSVGAVAPTARFHVGGTYTTAQQALVAIDATLVSSQTSTQQGFNFSPVFNPSGASLGTLYGAALFDSTISGSSSLSVTAYNGIGSRLNEGSGYGGTVSFGRAFQALDPILNSANPITAYYHYNGNAVTNGNNLASGTVTNRGLNMDAFTAGSAGGTVNNYAAQLTVPSGGSSSGTTNNRGLYITGNGGTASGGTVNNFAILSDSTAASSFAGTITVTAKGSSLADQIYDHDFACTSQLDKTSNTTLATVTGLSAVLVAGKTYNIEGWLSTTAGASGGLKVALVASGGLTATSCRFQAFAWNGTTAVANTTVTSLGSNIVANTAVVTDVYIKGSIVVNAGGTINVQAAQNASNGTTTSVFVGSTFSARRIN